MEPRSVIQRIMMRILPRAWAEDMRADSLNWMLRCSRGHERSVWEAGGIRWRAYGRPRVWTRCPECGQGSWHTFHRRQ
jgi:hypothetical protein